jgi:hypothetical protein
LQQVRTLDRQGENTRATGCFLLAPGTGTPKNDSATPFDFGSSHTSAMLHPSVHMYEYIIRKLCSFLLIVLDPLSFSNSSCLHAMDLSSPPDKVFDTSGECLQYAQDFVVAHGYAIIIK